MPRIQRQAEGRSALNRAAFVVKLLFVMLSCFELPAEMLAQSATQVFPTSIGAVEITPIYHASAVIRAGEDTIYIDPAPPANFSGQRQANLILITDIHPDHLNAISIAALRGHNTEIIAPAAAQAFVKDAKVLANGESIQWRGWKITAVAMYNLIHKMPNGEPFHPKGRGNGYVLSYGGKSFYFAGDTEGTAEMRALKGIDVAFIPMNLPYTMSVDEAAEAVSAFKPKVAIPYHYQGQDIQRFAHALEGTGIEVRLLNWYTDVSPSAQLPVGSHPKTP